MALDKNPKKLVLGNLFNNKSKERKTCFIIVLLACAKSIAIENKRFWDQKLNRQEYHMIRFR